jgi:predicted Zn finger-like uncharacterized protein
MGYSTDFKGKLEFTCPVTTEMLAKLNSFFGEDPKKHPDWNAHRDIGYVDLKLTKDFTGIEWDGSEKTYGLELSVDMVIREMRRTWPEFGLKGFLLAQGEDVEDRWQLVVGDNGAAKKVKVPMTGMKVRCPSCHQHFYVEDSQ